MSTNSWKCEICEEWFDVDEFWLDDMKVCENCYDDAVDTIDEMNEAEGENE